MVQQEENLPRSQNDYLMFATLCVVILTERHLTEKVYICSFFKPILSAIHDYGNAAQLAFSYPIKVERCVHKVVVVCRCIDVHYRKQHVYVAQVVV